MNQNNWWPLALIVLFPALGAAINGLWGMLDRRAGRPIPEGRVSTIAVAAAAGSFVVSVWAVLTLISLPEQAGHYRYLSYQPYSWIVTGLLHIDVRLVVDPLSAVMILIVTGIGSLIHYYSVGYMHGEEGYYRSFTYLNLFLFAMLILVLGGNFLLMFVGWEGVGLCSYLLIGYYYTKKFAADAGKKAFVVNRVGDFGFVIGMLFLLVIFDTLDFHGIFSTIPEHRRDLVQTLWEGGPTAVTMLTLALFLGACGKSAQIPLYVWLPDAMAGPTPVSALIHAATMVTAGVYMVARCHALFLLSPTTMAVVATIGALTALLAASIGLVQNDIKKVLAYSTVSQLGYMFLGCGVGAFVPAIFHVMTHAFFKACLFLGSGSVIHAMHHAYHHVGDHHSDPQDIRNMGALRKRMPWTFWTFLIATVAIAGVPPLAGFFSKDEILWNAFNPGNPNGHFLLWLIGWIVAGMTAFYMFRLVSLTFFGPTRLESEAYHHVNESPRSMTLPLVILAVLSVVGGWLNIPHVLGGHARLEHFLGFIDREDGVYTAALGLGVAEHGAAPGEHGAAEGHATVEPSGLPTEASPGADAAHAASETRESAHAASETRESAHAASETRESAAAHGSEAGSDGLPFASPEQVAAAHQQAATKHLQQELSLMWLSVGIACAGILIALGLYLVYPDAPGALRLRFERLYEVLYNKYYVDEFYDAAIIEPSKRLGERLGDFDRGVVDGVVNGVASGTIWTSDQTVRGDLSVVDGVVNWVGDSVIRSGQALRHTQTGFAQSYIVWMALGVFLLVVGYLVL